MLHKNENVNIYVPVQSLIYKFIYIVKKLKIRIFMGIFLKLGISR